MSQKFINGDNLKRAIDYLVDGTIPIANSNLAPGYDNTVAYKIGNLLTYLGKQYYCIADAPAGTLPTNTTYFEEKSVADIIEMIKNGSIVTGHSEVADNLTPYSEDSGTTQENPFISQGTGTDNNSVIVTTGAIARQLEKQGNTHVVNQFVQNNNFESTSGWSTTDGTLTVSDNTASFTGTASSALVSQAVNLVKGHKYLKVGTFKLSAVPSGNIWFRLFLGTSNDYDDTYLAKNTNWQTIFSIATCSGDLQGMVGVRDNSSSDWATIQMKDFALIDLTQLFNGNDNIPADLLANPSHFSWYYNGSLAYDAGSLNDCNGQYLECGQGRNLFDQQTEIGWLNGDGTESSAYTDRIRSKNYFLVVPNKPIYFHCTSQNYVRRVCFYDRDYNGVGYVDYQYSAAPITVPANAVWAKFAMDSDYGTTYKGDISIELYYTPEQGGEGYGTFHPYVAPIRIDTGNETLKAFDKKLPSGVIERNGTEIDLGTRTWTKREENGYFVFYSETMTYAKLDKAICSKYTYDSSKSHASLTMDKSFTWFNGTDANITIRDDSCANMTASEFKAYVTGVMFEYQLKDEYKTTEQGTPFSEYAPINDYSYMAWFDTDGNLVSIPQGCKLFYPVDYKGFVDDLVMYTNGDATALAKEEDITDTALNARGYYKMQDLSSGITDVAGLTYSIKKAYSIGNIAFIDITAVNETGSEISANAELFNVASGLFNAGNNQFFVVRKTGANAVLTLSWEGKGKLDTALSNNDVINIHISCAVG